MFLQNTARYMFISQFIQFLFLPPTHRLDFDLSRRLMKIFKKTSKKIQKNSEKSLSLAIELDG